MIIKNVKVYQDGFFTEAGIAFDETIREIGTLVDSDDAVDGQGAYLIPGLIDVHTHGRAGADAADGDPEGVITMSRSYLKDGVTSYCPTTVTLAMDEYETAVRALADYERPADGAKIAGIHLEGPFLNPEKTGAQNPDNIVAPEIGFYERMQEISGGKIRLITVAPEMEGVLDLIAHVSRSCVVSLGHTAADYETAMRAFDAGANHATHLFNAMPPLLHRAPGVIGAAYDAGADVELITDGIHSHPAIIRMAHALFREHLILISDSIRCAGLPEGDYELGGLPVTLKNGRVTLKDSDTIAGSSIHLMEGLRTAVAAGVPLEEAVYAATYAPARCLNMTDTIGVLAPGRAADMVLLDADLNIIDIYIDGKRIGDQ